MVFPLFWTLTRKTCILTGKFLVGLSKLLFTCPEKHLRSNISETKSWKLGDFWIIFEIFGTMAENIFRVWQNSNRCPEGTDYWKTFSKEKTSLFFSVSERVFTLSEKIRWICGNRNLRIRWSFWGKFFLNIYSRSDFFGISSKKP